MKGNCGECDRRWYCDINPDECDAWPNPVPMTNADHIRSMTDEELAEWLFKFFWGRKSVALLDMAGWLKQSYKEDT